MLGFSGTHGALSGNDLAVNVQDGGFRVVQQCFDFSIKSAVLR